MTQQLRVTQIARETGGEAFFPTSPKEIHEFYAKILDELASRYTIGYMPVVASRDGKFRRVEVRIKKPELKGARVRTRSGYLAPQR
jgi:Ca-activated chloride channel homolog